MQIQVIRVLTLLCFAFKLLACSSESTNSNSNDPHNNNNKNNNQPSGSVFQVRGILESGTYSSGHGLRAESAQSITDVLAINPSSTRSETQISSINEDGSFSLNLEAEIPWVLLFVDRTQVGNNMLVSAFRAESLDTLVPTSTGSLELGLVTMTGTRAVAARDYNELIGALGLSQDDALELGAVDDLCLRYVNPDIDGNGILDVLEPRKDFRLDFHVQFQMRLGNELATIADLMDDFIDEATTEYQGTSIYTSFPSSFSSANIETEGSATFNSEVEIMSFGEGGSSQTTIPANTAINGSNLIISNYSDYIQFGIFSAPEHELPQDIYKFGVGDETLTFTAVQTRSSSALQNGLGFVIPFVKFIKSDTNCTADCTISSIAYKWMKKTNEGWIDATQDELTLFVNPDSGFISIVAYTDSNNKKIGIQIPVDQVNGQITWSANNAYLENLDESSLSALKTTEVCHLGVSVDDKIGMRYFSGVQNAPGTCQ